MQTVTVIALGKLNAEYFRAAAKEYEEQLVEYIESIEDSV